MQHLTTLQSKKADNATNLSKFEYDYNTRDARTSVEKTIGNATTQTINFSYDDIDQLTGETSNEPNPLLDKQYSYDAMGNRLAFSDSGLATTYASNNLNQVTSLTQNNIATNVVYDANGNTLQIGEKNFGYDEANRLTSVVSLNEKKSEFVYDSDGRKRIAREYDWDAQAAAWVQSDETRFVYNGMDLVQERGADGTVKASYVRDGNIGGVLSRTTPEGTFYYHYDGNGNVVALTDANENIVAQYAYDAFGNTISSSGPQADKNPFRFSSKYYDGDTGLYDFGLRHYDSNLGRWINRDPIAEDGGLNLYGMVNNNPVSSVDAYGLLPNLISTGSSSAKVDSSTMVFDNERSFAGGHITITGSGIDKATNALRTIFSTKIGQRMLRAIKRKNLKIWIYTGDYTLGEKVFGSTLKFAGTFTDVSGVSGCSRASAIMIETTDQLWSDMTGKMSQVPFDAILMHELGHAAFKYEDYHGSGAGDNVNLVENPYRKARGYAPRTKYKAKGVER